MAELAGPELADVEAKLAVWRKDALAALQAASTLEELREAESSWLGKSSPLVAFRASIRLIPPEQRPAAGAAIQAVLAELESSFGRKRRDLEELEQARRLREERLDLSELRPSGLPGKRHVVSQAQEELEDIFVGLGFEVAEGPEVETDWHNFEALNMPPGHPARDAQDSFYVAHSGPEVLLLRTHTSSVQIRLMESRRPPIYAVAPGLVFRRDTPDSSHLPSFHQIEGLAVDRGLNFAHLAGTIEAFTKAFFGAEVRSRLRPSFFPFTEPSAEFDVTCPICSGSGCRTCGGSGWLEMGGCGMVDPSVFEAVGIDPETWSGFAFGFGLDRCAMVRWQVSDLRLLAEPDLRVLRQF
jgi:phenylalanyl-tRNA synthetase alpha chain